jgi:DNA-binding CsgD family transcriptional regulator
MPFVGIWINVSSSMDKAGLSRKEWFVALVAAHGGSSNEAASSLGVQPRAAEQLLETARRKLNARSSSEIRRVIPT